MNHKWVNQGLIHKGKQHTFTMLVERPLHPKGRQGGWEPSYTGGRFSRLIGCAVIEARVFTDEELDKLLQTLAAEKYAQDLAKRRRRAEA